MAKLEPTPFSEAPAVRRIAEELIAEHHPELEGKRIDYLFSSKPKKTHGKVALGWVTVVTGIAAWYGQEGNEDPQKIGEPFFLMVIDRRSWNFQLNSKQKVALVDHELCHLVVEEIYNKDGAHTGTNFKLRGHDLEEFADVVKRHGIWLEDVEEFREAIEGVGEQLSFTFVSQPDHKSKAA